MNSLLKIKEIQENAIFWIHGIEFSSEIWDIYPFWWIQKNSYMNWFFMNPRI